MILAAYQAADYVADAVNSALGQTLEPLEVIVCDDASTDGTAAVLASFGDRITLLRHTSNAGLAAARNQSTAAASGDFVVILDADDTWMAGRLEALAELARRRPDLDILTTDAYLTVGGKVVRRVYDRTWTFEVDDQRRAILERNFIFGHSAVRREALADVGGFDESMRRTEDWDCWLRMIHAGAAAGAVLEPLARYRVHPDALSSRRADMLRSRVRTQEKASRQLQLGDGERAALERSLAENRRLAAIEEARNALIEGDPRTRRLWRSIASDRANPTPTRLKAVAAALSPALARRIERHRAGRGFVGAAGVRVGRKRG